MRTQRAIFLTLTLPATALAGMPVVTLSEVAKARIDVISFFVVVYLMCAVVFRRLWNSLAKDFPWMPVLSFKRALALLIVAGLFLYFILTMISGARELMTPGAWAKQGVTYQLRTPERDPKTWLDSARRQWMETLREALREYASKHEGKLPPHPYVTDFNRALWQGIHPGDDWLIYVSGLSLGKGSRVLVYEPATYGEKRWALLTDGSVLQMKGDDLDARVRKEFEP